MLSAGVFLVAVAGGIFWLSDLGDLELEPVALLGVTVGGVLALVRDGSALGKAGGFLAGFVSAWALYALRAAWLPDSTAGKAVFAATIVALCVAACAVTLRRFPLWSTLLGAGAMAGAFEAAYVAAPPETLSTSVTAASSMALAVALGFLAASVVATSVPATTQRSGGLHWLPRQRHGAHEAATTIDELMENPR
ncbi:MAG TPA: hypothetical protein VFK52_12420 [Nocardioidaceae bacterium]|nr:hypothetical protein [Nocardioidaceae bacterium]